MIVEKSLPYRGEIRGIAASGGIVAFVTTHPEGHPGGFYRLDLDTLALAAAPLPGGGTAIAAGGDSFWLGDGRGQIATAPADGGPPKPIGPALDAPAVAIAPLVEGRLAVAVGARVVILDGKKGKPLQTLDLPETASCLAADPTGRWLAAGTSGGTVAVFESDGKVEFAAGGSGRLHDGAVTALLFEPDDLRFFSAGADLKLLSTHARGRLEPEDKGRGNNHADIVASMIWGPGERLYTGGRDGTIKSWPRAGAIKPNTTRDGVGPVIALAVATVHGKPRLVAACGDNTLRAFPVDPSGKIGDLSHRMADAYAAARQELADADAPRREAALRDLAGFGDARSVDLIAAQAATDADHALRLMAAEMLGASAHPKAAKQLEALLGHADEAVRVASFHGLRRHRPADDLGPIDLALKANKADIGTLAISALGGLAAQDDRALSRLVAAIDHPTAEVRQAALLALEAAHDPTSPEASLIALGSKHADLRRAALIRLFRRGMVADPAAQSALRRSANDADPEVRRIAFLLALHTRERLLAALRARDPELDRQLAELDGAPAKEAVKEKEKPSRKGKAQPTAPDASGLDDADREPLLQAAAGRPLDTSLRGAWGLAVLGDPRAFGLLLQLSREDEKTARAEVCRALGTLDDPRAIERLRSLLHDKEAEVRDAAFTALARIHQGDPLLAAASGLDASHEDVRRRGLQVLVAQARAGTLAEPARQLLARALNDAAPAVRSEAFKAALALKVGGAGAGPLRFASRSLHADVRREVLTEAMAQSGESWGLDLLLEFFNDPDPTLRGDSFAFATRKTRGLEFLEAALGSRYSDLRLRAIEGLVKKGTAPAQTLLARALDDEEATVRKACLDALVDADAVPALAKALDNAHPDVRLRAAKALARHGDPRAFPPLLALATASEPDERERRAVWLALVESALDGLGELGDPAALSHLIPLLDSPHAPIRKHAARALARIAGPESADALRQALSHSDPEVKYAVALGLACIGDASVASLVFSDAAGKVITAGDQLIAALALGDPGEGRLAVLLDHADESIRSRALLLLLMREWKDPRETPARCLAALAAREPRLRLLAARAIEALADPAAFAAFVAERLNDRGEKPAGKIPGRTVDALAEILVHGSPQPRSRAARLLPLLDAEEPDAFLLAWKAFEARFAAEIADLARRAAKRRPPQSKADPDRLQDLAFGAYVGLAREQKGEGKGSRPDAVRQTALARLLELARLDARHARAALPVFVQALGDPAQPVRSQAFDQALALGMPASGLAGEALASGHVDLGVRGLELLTGGASEEAGRAVLEQAMLARTDDLASEAAKLLIARLGPVAVGAKALGAANPAVRRQAVLWLSAEYDKDPASRDALRQALRSRYSAVREDAAFKLASHKDPAAFEVLVALLREADQAPSQLRRSNILTGIIMALESLGDPRTPDALLDRVADDPAGTAPAAELIRAVGRARRPEVADRLFALIEKDPKRREVAFDALLAVAGYDQSIDDPEDERADPKWEAEQHPRHDDLLARMLDRLSAPGDAKLLARLIPGARWARGKAVDAPLGRLIGHGDETVRRAAVEALGWRLRKRDGDAEPLRKALGHPDPLTQFAAAEGLARAGRPDGLNVLLASLDFVDDLGQRRRAVRALGELADERAFEILLKLAGEEGHALQEAAAEAIGHLGQSPRADEIFRLLERQSRGESGLAFAAVHGLRWLGTPAAWRAIRERAADPGSEIREFAIDLLGYDPDPAGRDLLLRLLATLDDWSDGELRDVALEAARRSFGPESLEPDYAVLRNEEASSLDGFAEILGRVRERGEPGRIFALLPACSDDEAREALRSALLDREEPPIAEARAALDSPDPSVAGLAARILGRAGGGASGAGAAVAEALGRWRRAWEAKRPGFDPDDSDTFDPITEGVRDLAWAAGRLGGAAGELAEMLMARPDDPAYRPIRREAALALAAGPASPEALSALEAAALAGDPEVRAIAAQAVARLAPARTEGLAERLMADAVGFRRLALDGAGEMATAIRAASRQVHYQGIVLPGLIDRGEVEALAAVAEDRDLPDATRLGALEGLAAIAREPAEEVIRRVGTNEAEDEDLRKAAWRCLSRSKRARAKADKTRAEATP
ncbi:HEAT repeat domain-containing protein [Tundrisphaera sp. TA3]|uniref:HEAT repeat domain-containing protein n=1 Tax=Tundrisphaera sp. TA3 TaxID=3435775 RepID=UPI003EBE62B4